MLKSISIWAYFVVAVLVSTDGLAGQSRDPSGGMFTRIEGNPYICSCNTTLSSCLESIQIKTGGPAFGFRIEGRDAESYLTIVDADSNLNEARYRGFVRYGSGSLLSFEYPDDGNRSFTELSSRDLSCDLVTVYMAGY